MISSTLRLGSDFVKSFYVNLSINVPPLPLIVVTSGSLYIRFLPITYPL